MQGISMTTLTGSARTYLRGLAHHLNPVVQLGKNGMTESFLDEVNRALDIHELIKVKFTSFKTEKKTLSKAIAEQTRSEMLGLIGNIVILYREQHDPAQRKIQIPENQR
jgi:RNA-binding protein